MGEGAEIGSGIGEEESGITPDEGDGSMAAGPAKFVHEGEAIDYTPGADVLTGAVVVQAELVGVARGPIKAGQLGSLAVSGAPMSSASSAQCATRPSASVIVVRIAPAISAPVRA